MRILILSNYFQILFCVCRSIVIKRGPLKTDFVFKYKLKDVDIYL